MGRSERQTIETILEIPNHEQRFLNIKRALSVFEKDPGLLTRRAYESLRKALLFLSSTSNKEGIGNRFMDHERVDAGIVLLRLRQIRRSKLFGLGKLDPEVSAKPAVVIPNDSWDRFRFREVEEEEEKSDDESKEHGADTGREASPGN